MVNENRSEDKTVTSRRPTPPCNASFAESGPDGRMHAPSAARNVEAILKVLAQLAPPSGTALEIASGTGQHIATFAAVLPALTWQPSDIDADRLASIAAWTASLPNVRAPIRLDATEPGWSDPLDAPDLIYLSNLLHLIALDAARTAVTEACRLLAPGGRMLIYGPFRRGADFASDGDRNFHASLTAQDPEIGYKSFETVQAWQLAAGLLDLGATEMPANNLILSARKPD